MKLSLVGHGHSLIKQKFIEILLECEGSKNDAEQSDCSSRLKVRGGIWEAKHCKFRGRKEA